MADPVHNQANLKASKIGQDQPKKKKVTQVVAKAQVRGDALPHTS